MALTSLRRLRCPAPHGTWWAAALRCAAQRRAEFGAGQHSALLRCLAEAGWAPSQGWLAAWLVAGSRAWGAMAPGHWVEVWWALARMKVPVHPSWFFGAFAATRPLLTALPGPQLALLAWSVAELQQQPPHPWRAAFMQAARPHLPLLPPSQLLRLLWAANRISHAPDADWLAAAVGAVGRVEAAGGWNSEQEQLAARMLQLMLQRYQQQQARAAQQEGKRRVSRFRVKAKLRILARSRAGQQLSGAGAGGGADGGSTPGGSNGHKSESGPGNAQQQQQQWRRQQQREIQHKQA
ncbi:hypothetical protein V8C86DRAFT_1212393 [Haematococcus lacustris]